jgi:hypothetical protein
MIMTMNRKHSQECGEEDAARGQRKQQQQMIESEVGMHTLQRRGEIDPWDYEQDSQSGGQSRVVVEAEASRRAG